MVSRRLKLSQLLLLLVAAVLVESSPDPGRWTFQDISSEQNYIGVVKNVYADTKLFIRVKCSSEVDNLKISIGWMVRRTPCWEEYLMLDSESRIYGNYYENPTYGRDYYASVLPNHTVQYVKPPPLVVDCGSAIILQPVAEEEEEAPPAGPEPQPAAAAPAAGSGVAPAEPAGAGPEAVGGLKRNKALVEEKEANLNTANVKQKREVSDMVQALPMRSSGASDTPLYVIKNEGVYLLVVSIQSVEPIGTFRASLDIELLSPSGYLSVTDWPLLPFYGAMCGVYVLLGLLWLIFCAIHWRDILRLQFWIGGVIFLGMVEKAMFTSEYQNINLVGQTTQGLILSAEIISCAKRTLARMLVIIVSLGFGIVKPRLGPTLNKVVGIGGLYFVLACAESVLRVIQPKNDPSNVTLMSAVPLAVIDASICWWVFSALIQTTRALRLRRNLVKLSVYKHFTNTLVFAVLSSIIFMLWSIKYHKVAECLTDWRNLWLDEAFWHLLFSVILLVIMVLWRPSQNNQRYAFTPLLDGEEDASSEDEEILYNDAWDGMKMRNKGTSRPETPPSGADPEEDPLAWVEENIAGIEPALPALDSEEEIETTKMEISKLM